MKEANANILINTRIKISAEERKIAKKIAKAQGFTFQGWLGNLVRKAIKDYITVTPPRISNINHSSDSSSLTTTFRKD